MKSTSQARPNPQGGFKVHDVLFVLFKHKWKILFLTLLGLIAAGVLYRKYSLSPTYESKAKLLVRYIVQRNTSDPEAPDEVGTGMAARRTELEILQSFDLAIDAAAALGPEKLLPDQEAPTASLAANRIVGGFLVTPGKDNSSIYLAYRDRDPNLSVAVLTQLIQTYFARHLSIHRSTEAYDEVSSQADRSRDALRATIEEINRLKSEFGVLSINGTIAEFESRRQLARGNLMIAEAALAEQQAKVEALDSSLSIRPTEDTRHRKELMVANPGMSAAEDLRRRTMAEAVVEYQDLLSRLELLRSERNRLLLRRPAEDPMISALDRQITSVQKKSSSLATNYPEITSRLPSGVANSQSGGQVPLITNLGDEKAVLKAIEARVKLMTEQVNSIESEVAGLSALEIKLAELEHRRAREEETFRLFQTRLEKARIDEALDPSRIPNILILQNPSTPVKSFDEKTKKAILGVAGSGLFLGLALAFLIELVIDRRVTRPADIQSRLQLPLMLSIPFVRLKTGHGKQPLPAPKAETESCADDETSCFKLLPKSGDPFVTEQTSDHFIVPYANAIHDRILFNFHINNITHKPKLIGLTGLSNRAGVSTIAGGLARSFSENGNRKVLLVDLNAAVRDISDEKHPTESLRRAMDVSKSLHFRQSSQNLYFASAPMRRDGQSATSLAPITLHEIMPHLLASDFDYIIFDMPLVGATSPTLTIAGFMDKVLLVLDGENTNRENLTWAYWELERGKADVSCIFNKARSHAPRWVQEAI